MVKHKTLNLTKTKHVNKIFSQKVHLPEANVDNICSKLS